MNGLVLYKFINDNNIEWHWCTKDGQDDVWICLYYHQLEDFRKILTLGLFDDEGMEIIMKDDYLVITMNYICEYYDIEITDIFSPYKRD